MLSELSRQQEAAFQAKTKAELMGDPGLISQALLLEGIAMAKQGDNPGALMAFARIEQLCAGQRCEHEKAEALSATAVVHYGQNDPIKAKQEHEEARDIFQRLGDHDREAGQLNDLAAIAGDQGDLSGAARLFEQAYHEYHHRRPRSAS